METCHLVLKHKWYDRIESGQKTVEYRDDTEYWRKRILKSRFVCFHRGYSNVTMLFQIVFKLVKDGKIEVHLGTRVR